MGATIHTLESFTTIVQPIGQTQERLQRMPTMAKMWETLIEVNKKVRELTENLANEKGERLKEVANERGERLKEVRKLTENLANERGERLKDEEKYEKTIAVLETDLKALKSHRNANRDSKALDETKQLLDDERQSREKLEQELEKTKRELEKTKGELGKRLDQQEENIKRIQARLGSSERHVERVGATQVDNF